MSNITHRPTLIITVYLFLLYALALYLKRQSLDINLEIIRLSVLALSWFAPFFVIKLVFKTPIHLGNLFITFLILLLVTSLTANIPQVFFLGISSSSIKILLREKTGPIFNPAAIGIFLSSLLVKLPPTWWGVSFAPRLDFFNMSIANLLTVPIGLFIIFKYQKLPSFISIPIFFSLVYYIATRHSPLPILLEGTFIFFLFVMATEPKTTPLLDTQEWFYGIALGSVLALFFIYRPTPTPYITTLLVLNLIFALQKWIAFKRIRV